MVASDVQNCLFSSINLFIFYTCTIGSHWKRTYLEVMLPTRIISASRLVTLCIVNFSELLLYYKIALVTWWSCCSLGTCWRFWSCHSVFSKRNGDLISKMVHCIAVLNVHFIFHKANRHCAVVYICLKVFSWVCQEKWSWGNEAVRTLCEVSHLYLFRTVEVYSAVQCWREHPNVPLSLCWCS